MFCDQGPNGAQSGGPGGPTGPQEALLRAVQSSKAAAHRRQPGVRGLNFARSTALHRVNVYPGAGSLFAAVPEIQNPDPPALLALLCFALLAKKMEVTPLGPNLVM